VGRIDTRCGVTAANTSARAIAYAPVFVSANREVNGKIDKVLERQDRILEICDATSAGDRAVGAPPGTEPTSVVGPSTPSPDRSGRLRC
jgi:hypothetical protein